MNAVRGKVRDGRIETEAELPEGAEVVVLTASTEAPFDLDDAQLGELESRIASADAGDVETSEVVLGRLRSRR